MDNKRKVIIIVILGAMVLTLGIFLYNYWYDNAHYVTTEDAKVMGDFVRVTPQISGKLIDLTIQEGDMVKQDQVVGQISAMGSAFVRAPISGLVIKKQSSVGEFVTAGSSLALMVDPKKLYIAANIEETKISKVAAGQPVSVTIDQFGGRKFKGFVRSVAGAANSAFSLLPSSSSTTFTKVVQKIQVKIDLENTNLTLLPGANAIVKIQVR